MTHTDKDLDHLSDLLNGLPLDRDGMTLAEFDGYVAGLLVCPEMIMPSEWLPEDDVAFAEPITGLGRRSPYQPHPRSLNRRHVPVSGHLFQSDPATDSGAPGQFGFGIVEPVSLSNIYAATA